MASERIGGENRKLGDEASIVNLQGADHGVSEALYLKDPDANGIELYWDRPRTDWPQSANGALTMFPRPLALEGLLAEG